MKLKCENNELFISPLLRDIFSTFHSFIDNIANAARQLPTLESWVNVKTENEFIPVILPEWYLQQSHQRLAHSLETMFQPLNTYVEEFHEQFQTVYNPDTHEKIINYIAQGHDFATCLDKIEEFKEFVSEINGIVSLRFDY